MIHFIIANQSVLDPNRDGIVDYLYQQMKLGPVLWVEPEENLILIEQWCHELYPRRLLLQQSHQKKAEFKPGKLNTITPDLLPYSTQDMTIFSRGLLIPPDTKYRLLVHWIDDDREKNRECYRNYQLRGHKPETLQL